MKKITAVVPDECEIEVLQAIRMVTPSKQLKLLTSEDYIAPTPTTQLHQGNQPESKLTSGTFNGA